MSAWSNMSFGKKCGIGFGVVIALLAVVAFTADRGLGNASNGFRAYRELARDSLLVGELNARMQGARFHVKNFLVRGLGSDVESFRATITQLDELTERAQSEIQHPQRAEKVDYIETQVGSYRTAFERVVEIANERAAIVKKHLDVVGRKQRQTLSDIASSAKDDDDAVAGYFAGVANNHWMLARLYANKFLDRGDVHFVSRVREEFDEFEAQLEILDEEVQNESRRALLAKVEQGLGEYQSRFNRVVDLQTESQKLVADVLDVV